MDFEFSPEQQAFLEEVEAFLDEQRRPRRLRRHPREHGPDRRHARSAGRSWPSSARRAGSGMTWPKEYGGTEGEGVYEYLLNEALAGRGGPQIGKGVGIIGKTIIAHGSDFLKAEVPARDPAQRGRVRRRLQRAQRRLRRRLDAAQGRARRAGRRPAGCSTARRPGPPRPTSPSGTGCGARTDPDNKHHGITLMLVPLDQPGITINGIWTMGDERTNEVFLDDVFVPDDYVVGEVNHGLPVHLPGARPRALHDVHVRADQAAPRPAVRVRAHRRRATASRSRTTRSSASASPSWPPRPRWPGCMGLRVVAESMKAEQGAGHAAAHRRVVGVQAVRHRVLQAPGQRVDGHRRPRHAAAGARPRTPRWRAGPSRPTATP